VKLIAMAAAVGVVFWIGFIVAAVNTICDDSYWPDWT